MNFGEAIQAMKLGKKVCRNGWNGKGVWLAIQNPDEHSKMTGPYIYMKTAQDDLIPWLASHADMLADDWELKEETTTPTPAADGLLYLALLCLMWMFYSL